MTNCLIIIPPLPPSLPPSFFSIPKPLLPFLPPYTHKPSFLIPIHIPTFLPAQHPPLSSPPSLLPSYMLVWPNDLLDCDKMEIIADSKNINRSLCVSGRNRCAFPGAACFTFLWFCVRVDANIGCPVASLCCETSFELV